METKISGAVGRVIAGIKRHYNDEKAVSFAVSSKILEIKAKLIDLNAFVRAQNRKNINSEETRNEIYYLRKLLKVLKTYV